MSTPGWFPYGALIECRKRLDTSLLNKARGKLEDMIGFLLKKCTSLSTIAMSVLASNIFDLV